MASIGVDHQSFSEFLRAESELNDENSMNLSTGSLEKSNTTDEELEAYINATSPSQITSSTNRISSAGQPRPTVSTRTNLTQSSSNSQVPTTINNQGINQRIRPFTKLTQESQRAISDDESQDVDRFSRSQRSGVFQDGKRDGISARLGISSLGMPYIPVRRGRKTSSSTKTCNVKLFILMSRKAYRVPCSLVKRKLTSIGLGEQEVTLEYGDVTSIANQLQMKFPILTPGSWQGIVGPRKPVHAELPCLNGIEGLKSLGLTDVDSWWNRKTAVLYIRPVKKFPSVIKIDDNSCVSCYFGHNDEEFNVADFQLKLPPLEPIEKDGELTEALSRLQDEVCSFEKIASVFFKLVDPEAEKLLYRNPISVLQDSSFQDILAINFDGKSVHDFLSLKYSNSAGVGDGPHREVLSSLASKISARCFVGQIGSLRLSSDLYEQAKIRTDSTFKECFVRVGSLIARMLLNGGRGPTGLHPILKHMILKGAVDWSDSELLLAEVHMLDAEIQSNAVSALQRWIRTEEWPQFQQLQNIQAACEDLKMDCEIFRRLENPKELLVEMLFLLFLQPTQAEISDLRKGLHRHGILKMVEVFPTLETTVFARPQKLTADTIRRRIVSTPPTTLRKLVPILRFFDRDEEQLKKLLIYWSGQDFIEEDLKLYESTEELGYIFTVSTCTRVLTIGEKFTVNELYEALKEELEKIVYNKA